VVSGVPHGGLRRSAWKILLALHTGPLFTCAPVHSGGNMAHTAVTERGNVLDRTAPRGSQPFGMLGGHVRALYHIREVHVRLTPRFRSFCTAVLPAVAKVQRVTTTV
jgi:hypothetical protein